ncbi:MAG: PilN domain-containing protein [Nitrospiria bacterium]
MDNHINLLQRDLLEEKAGRETASRNLFLPILLLIIVSMVVGAYIQDGKQEAALRNVVETVRRQRDQLRRQIEAVSTASKSPAEKPDGRSGFILEERVVWSHILREVSLVVPKETWITELENAAGEGVRILGFARSHQKVTDLMASLESSDYFQDVLLEFSRRNPSRGKIDFSIHTRIRREVKG